MANQPLRDELHYDIFVDVIFVVSLSLLLSKDSNKIYFGAVYLEENVVKMTYKYSERYFLCAEGFNYFELNDLCHLLGEG